MKKIILSVSVLTVLVSCINKTNYSQDQLNGTWENLEKTKSGCTNQLVIQKDSMYENTICANSNASVGHRNYKFDGNKTITVKTMGMDATYTINSLTATSLDLTVKCMDIEKK